MAVAEILSSIRGFISSSSKSQNDFKNESNKNNKNISNAVRDISRMFSAQRSVNERNESSISEILDVTQSTYTTTQQNNALLQESISLQNNMLQELKKISSGVGSLIKTIDESELGSQNRERGGIGAAAMRAAAGAFGLGAVALPGLLNNYFGRETGGSNVLDQSQFYGNSDTAGGERLSVAEMAKLAKEAGFSNEEAKTMAAIAASESGGKTSAHNPNAATGDNSYGLWQINMLGNMGPQRRAQFGIRDDSELFDPKKNAEAAYKVFKEQGFNAWSDYKNGKYLDYMGTAEKVNLEGDELGVHTTPTNTKPAEGLEFGGLNPQSTPTNSGVVHELQEQLAGIRKKPINEELRRVLRRAASEAGVEVVVYSGGQSPAGSGGPRTGSTRHDHGNAADLYLVQNGRKLRDPEDRETMAKFVSSATAAGATGIGFGGEGKYMGASSIHVGFGRPATWGGSPWIAQAASGVYSNKDLATTDGTALDKFAAGGLDVLKSAFEVFGLGNIDPANFLSNFFGVPLLGAEVKKGEDGKETYGATIEEESTETEDLMGMSSEKKPTVEEKKLSGGDFVNYEQQSSLADQIKDVSMMMSNPIVITNPAVATPTSEREVMTDFGATGNQPLNTRASWAPRIAVLRPDERATENIRWAARVSPNLIA